MIMSWPPNAYTTTHSSASIVVILPPVFDGSADNVNGVARGWGVEGERIVYDHAEEAEADGADEEKDMNHHGSRFGYWVTLILFILVTTVVACYGLIGVEEEEERS